MENVDAQQKCAQAKAAENPKQLIFQAYQHQKDRGQTNTQATEQQQKHSLKLAKQQTPA
jgi:hypothetical protein